MMENIPRHKNCINCGGCCGVIPATQEEISTIRKYLEDKPEVRIKAKKTVTRYLIVHSEIIRLRNA